MPEQEKKIDVFVSYSSADRKKAAAIVAGLEQHGLTVWWDKELKARDKFSDVIEKHLDAARAVVVLWTVSSVKKNFVKEEAIRAQAKLIPVLLDEAQPPLGFGQFSHVNLRAWNGDELSLDLDRLVESIAQIRQGENKWRKPSTWLVLRGLILDLRTRIALCVVAGIFLTAWLAWGRIHWHVADTQWVVLLGLWVALAWLFVRGTRLARSKTGLAFAAAAAALALASWAFGCYSYYRLPKFPADAAGILVGRFHDDFSDKLQLQWAGQLEATKSGEATSAVASQALVPVSIKLMRRESRDDGEARRLLEETGALLAIWGSDSRPAAMTFASLPGFAKMEGLAPVGSMDLDDAARPPPGLSQAVLLLSAAFAAFRDEDYEVSQQLLERIPDLLSDDGSPLTTATSMLSTAYLLLGNIYMLAGCKDADQLSCIAAIDYYERARRIFTGGDKRKGNRFVEVSNNLAVARYKLTKKFATSHTDLEDADSECQAMRADPPLACPFVRYNLALLAIEANNYDLALEKLAAACPEHVHADARQSESTFLAQCRQQQAYSEAKLGESTTSDTEAARHFISAQKYLDQAVAALPDKDNDAARLKVSITRARIAIGQREFVKARDLLAPLVTDNALDPAVARMQPGLDGAEISALYTVARICTQETSPTEASLSSELSSPTLNYLTRRIEGCSTTQET